MLTVTVDASQAERLLGGIPGALTEAITDWVLKGGQLVVGEMRAQIRERTRGPAPTGQLAGSVQADVQGASAVIGPTTRATKWGPFDPVWVDQPTAPHMIYPRFKEALAFPRSGAGPGTRGGLPVSVFRFGGKTQVSMVVFAKGVSHPGTKGMFFIEATRDQVEQPLQELLDFIVSKKVEALKK